MGAVRLLEESRLPPQSPELEQAVLGACLLESSGMASIADVIRPGAFYVPAHAEIWNACLTLYTRRDPVDILTVTKFLQASGKLDSVGGAFYISTLTNRVASSANVDYHARLILQDFMCREIIRLGGAMQQAGFDPTTDVFDKISMFTAELRVLNEYSSTAERTMSEIMPDVIVNIGVDRGVCFGFDALDRKIRLEPGTVTIIGARPGMGKTAFMLSSAWKQAQAGRKVYVQELEMKDRNLATRLACGENGIPIWKAKRKLMSQVDEDRLARWHVNSPALANMIINEAASISVSSLGARLDRAKRKHGIDMVWIDYLGLLQPSVKQRPGYDRMTAISNELRVLSKDLDLPFAVLAQLSRPAKGMKVDRPKLTDLRDSGEIEQDAEAVCFLHRPKYYDQSAGDEVEFIVAKYRDGEDGIEHLLFDPQGVRMLDKAPGTPSPEQRSTPGDSDPF